MKKPFLPASAVVNVGTAVIWFNGDIGYEHKILITQKGLQGSPSKRMTNSFSYHEGSKSVILDSLGQFEYSEAKEYQNGFVMRGTIMVINNMHPIHSVPSLDTVGVLMVPTEELLEYIEVLKSKRFIVNSIHSFKNLSGEKKNVGDKQALLVWGTFEMDISQVMDTLREISFRLPYS